MIVIGITGPIGHGKSTFAKTLLKREKLSVHEESSMIISEVANQWLDLLPEDLITNPYDLKVLNLWIAALAEVVSEQLRLIDYKDVEITAEALEKDPEGYERLFMFIDNIKQGMIERGVSITEENKDRYRSLLQWLGGYLVKKIDKEIWYGKIEENILEAEGSGKKLFIAGGIRFPSDAEVIRRNGGIIIQVMRKGLIVRDSGEFTESQRNKIHIDCNIVSDAGVEALVEASNSIYDDILSNTLMAEYQTSDFAF